VSDFLTFSLKNFNKSDQIQDINQERPIMKKLLVLTLLLNSFAYSQELPQEPVLPENKDPNHEYPVITFQKFTEEEKAELDLTDAQIATMKGISRNHLSQIVKDPEEFKRLEIIGMDILLPKTTLFPPTPQSFEARLALNNLGSPSYGFQNKFCNPLLKTPQNFSTPLGSLIHNSNQIIEKMEDDQIKKKNFNPGQIYFIWGYNRGWHSKSDATFTTADGTFTIHDAHGNDRPSTDLIDYIKPSHILIPQYNLRIGYQLTPKWSIEVGMDHMKWVFDPNRPYHVTGDYDRTVYVQDPNDPHNLFGYNFDQVKQTGDMRWLTFEHSDGYNYAFVAGVYKHNLYSTRNEKFKVDALGGAGLGPMIPKTKVMFHQDTWWNWEGLDNKFHVAGFGGHAEGKLRLTYGPVFAEAAGRYTLVKLNNALVNDQGARLEHTPISSFQFIGAVGVNVPISKKEKKKVP
jgi:hypothetical protein